MISNDSSKIFIFYIHFECIFALYTTGVKHKYKHIRSLIFIYLDDSLCVFIAIHGPWFYTCIMEQILVIYTMFGIRHMSICYHCFNFGCILRWIFVRCIEVMCVLHINNITYSLTCICICTIRVWFMLWIKKYKQENKFRNTNYYYNKCKKLISLKECLTAAQPTSHNKNSKNKKGAITFAARRHNVNVLLRSSTFLIFAVLVVWCRLCRR